MNRDVYAYALRTIGKSPLYWVGLVAEFVRTVMLRVWVVIVMAQIAKNLAGGDITTAKMHAWWFLGIYVVGSIIGALGEWLGMLAENLNYPRASRMFYLKLVGKDMSFYRDHQSGYLSGLYRQHLEGVTLLARFIRTDAIRAIVSLGAPIIVLWSASWQLGMATVVIVVVQAIYVVWSSAQVKTYRMRSHEVYRKAGGEVSDNITNIVAFKSGGETNYDASRVAALSREEVEVYLRRFQMGILFNLPREIITAAGMTGAILLVLTQSTAGSEAVGLIVLTLTYLFQLVRTVSDLPDLMTRHDDLVAKLHPTFAYLGTAYETILDPSEPKPLHIAKGGIAFNAVNFGYTLHEGGKKQQVFKDLTVTIKGGQRVGIVGLSGAGKSTLASLLMRFDEIDRGSISIDGTDIRDVEQSDLRKKISYVPQEPLLFHRSVRENIAYFKDNATEEDIIRAAKAAYAHDFILKLSGGYDAMVGERGVKLSGGQKQRIVIARAVLKNAPIIIFDEATSALDTESEKIIQHALPEIIGKHTAIVIAHRLSTIAGLDRILVMHDGHIVEDGTHEELLTLGGRYWSLWQKQIGGHQTS